jgi:hypothetical protein
MQLRVRADRAALRHTDLRMGVRGLKYNTGSFGIIVERDLDHSILRDREENGISPLFTLPDAQFVPLHGVGYYMTSACASSSLIAGHPFGVL